MQGTLALTFMLPSGLPAIPEARHLRIVSHVDEDPDFAPQPTPRSELPDSRRWAAQLVQALVEVLTGDRPATQLVRWTTPSVYFEIRTATRALWHGADAAARRMRPGAACPSRAVVWTLHLSEPVDGAAEVCATIRRGARAATVALRLDGVDGRWQCTALQLG